MLTLVWYGTRISLLISLLSVTLGLVIGTLLGLVAGYYRGWLERIIGWITDILLAFPSILLAIAVATVVGPSLQSVMIAVGVVQIPIFSRLTRSMVLSLREQGFVQTVRAFGAKSGRIIFRHILPSKSGSAGGAGDAIHWHRDARSRRARLFGARSQAPDAGAGHDAVRFIYQRLCAVGSLDNFDAGTDDYADCAGVQPAGGWTARQP